MAKKYRIQNKNLGTSPGTLTYIGEEVQYATKISLIEYNEFFCKESKLKKLIECKIEDKPDEIIWLNVDGIHEPKVVETIGHVYGLHPLVMEDIVNTQQKPKFEYFNEDQLFLTLKMIEYNPHTRDIEVEHLNFILGHKYLISFQEERNRDVFENVKIRLKASAGKTRKNGSDYLLYALMDLVVDNYFLVLEKIGEDLERLEEEIIHSARQRSLNELYQMKREVMLMRKIVFPLREMLVGLIREEAPLITENTTIYLRDVYDHVSQVLETIDSYRELITSLMDLYLSQVSNKMNNVMKVLTVISVIFIPLTFLAGIYGMNFDNMPELHWHYGYYGVWGIMIALVIVMLLWFKRKDWL
ncbi:magnesium transporter [Pseudarcicella hirudinis]|uniref:Magnesium transport protein CorA n=1 Tax=Pseudarcicella hirudinis TaxID=1079859 RepID=A0A1I5RZX1_9BACT|nr:magnesium/cobalt transporter CorA [Pseudarcicella hirudinis]SFP64020.1 magnesium transporter [Pseudarcicella hirudinis]